MESFFLYLWRWDFNNRHLCVDIGRNTSVESRRP
jgi:hypothetical protein